MSQVSAPHEEAVHFYQVDARGFSFQEYRWGSPWPIAVLGWVLARVLRVKLPGSMDVPPVSALEPFEVSEQDWGQDASTALGPQVESLAVLGFTDPVYHNLFHAPTATLYQTVTLRHDSGQAMAQVCRRSWQYTRPAKDRLWVEMVSAVGEGGFAVTSSAKPDVQLPTQCRVQYETGASNEALWHAHQQRLGGMRAEPITTQQAMRVQVARYHHEVTSYQTQRGAMRKLDVERDSRAMEIALRDEPITAEKAKREGVLWQIHEQQHRSGTLRSTLMLLLISIILFVVLGATAWPLRFVLLLIPILLFHELGHLLAMWVFRYRNLRMFFIPLMGAAVTGQHYTVAGWKKTIVYLMGPVPGILVGIVIGIAAMVTGHELLLELAGLMLIINGFNLLPFPPLDGGWIASILVTSRNYMLDIVFRSLAAFGLIVLGLALGTQLIWILGLLILMSLGAVYRVGKVVDEVRRRRDLPSPGDASEELDSAMIEPLIEGLEAQTKRGLTSKTMAQQVLLAYESLYARPPGVLAALGLGAVYVGSFCLAALFGMVLLLTSYVDLSEFMSDAIGQPIYHYNCTESPTAQRLDLPDGSTTLIASYPSESQARELLATLAAEAPQGVLYDVAGQTAFLVLPSGATDQARAWSARLEARGGDVIVHQPDARAMGRLMLFVPSLEKAEELEHIFGGYLVGGSEMALIPPWSTSHSFTDEHDRARRTYLLLTRTGYDYEDDQLVTLNEQASDAFRFGEEERVEELNEKVARRMETLRLESRQALLAEHGDALDSQVIELYDQMPTYESAGGDSEVDFEKLALARKAWAEELSHLLGRQPDADDDMSTQSPDSVYDGYIHRNGLILSVEWCVFNEPAVGLPAVMQWLCDQGVRSQYQLYEGGDYYGF